MDLDAQLRQSAHAQKEKTLRAIMDGMGVIRSQARQVLHQKQISQVPDRFSQGHAPDARDFADNLRPMVKRSEFILPARREDQGVVNPNVVPGGGGVPPTGTPQSVIVVIAGAPYTADVLVSNLTPI